MHLKMWSYLWLVLFLLAARPVQAAQIVEFRGGGPKPGDPSLSTKPLDPVELHKLSLVDLNLLRDGIYARRGHTPFRVAFVDAYFRAQSWYVPKGTVLQSDLGPTEVLNARLIAQIEDQRWVGELNEIRHKIQQKGNMDYTDNVEVALTWEYQRRLEAMDGLDASKKLDPDHLRKLDRGTLSVMRNQIFARRGRSFNEKMIGEFFKNRGYIPDPHFSNAMLSSTDWYNIDLIRKIENEKGGPLQELDRYFGGR